MNRETLSAFAVICALLVGALARDVFTSRAEAEEAALRRSDVERILKALETQAQAAKDMARECRR